MLIGRELGLWAAGVCLSVLAIWAALRGRMRVRQYRQIAKTLEFAYLGDQLPGAFSLKGASFWDSWDQITDVITGVFKGVETVAFHFQTSDSEVGYGQTTVAMKSAFQIVALSSLWHTSGIHAEKVGEWILMFRPKEAIPPANLPTFIDDCRALLQFFEDHQTPNDPT